MSDRRYCNQPDRDVPAVKCGYPLPCPYHTVVIEAVNLDDGVEKVIDLVTALRRPTAKRNATEGQKP